MWQASQPAAGGLQAPAPRAQVVAGSATPRVAILMGTLQGGQYLAEQLDSLLAQQHGNWRLWVSDDGSTDDTLEVLQRYRAGPLAGRLEVLRGPSRGLAANFLSLACRDGITAEYYAFCDQDDIWDADKLTRALVRLAAVPAGLPALYASRTRLVDARNHPIGLSPLFRRPPCFANALVQNIGGGNTMVFNAAARRLLCSAGPDVAVVAHDWWMYLLVAGCGGHVCYDDHPTLRYRQHDGNLMGSNSSLGARVQRASLLWQGVFRQWNDNNIMALQRVQDLLAPAQRERLERFAQARRQGLVARLQLLAHSGVFRQTLLGNLGLLAAAFLGKL